MGRKRIDPALRMKTLMINVQQYVRDNVLSDPKSLEEITEFVLSKWGQRKIENESSDSVVGKYAAVLSLEGKLRPQEKVMVISEGETIYMVEDTSGGLHNVSKDNVRFE